MNERMKPLLSLFSGLQIALYLMLILALSTGYLYILTKNLIVSIVVGFITMFFFFDYLVYKPKKVAREHHLLKELQKYATHMQFYMQSGYNVLKALEETKQHLDSQIQEDIQITIDRIKKDAVLDTEHFKKYKFHALNIFHQILEIKYDKGGKTKELFSQVNRSINFEIVKRDELFRRKRYMKRNILIMMGMVSVIPLVLALMSKSLYEVFMSIGVFAIGLNVLIFILLLISLHFLQRASYELSIHY